MPFPAPPPISSRPVPHALRERDTRVAQRALLVLGLFAALPVPMAFLMGHANPGPHFVTCSAAHPCLLQISQPGVPFSALRVREWMDSAR